MPSTRELLDLPVKRLMTLHPATVGPEDTLGDAARIMVEGGFRHVPVVDPDDRVVGMLSERDLRERLGAEVERFPAAAQDLLVEQVELTMRSNPITVGADTPLRDVIGIFGDEKIGAVPVVDAEERLVGIVSYLDLLGYLRSLDSAGAAPAG